MTGSFNKSLLFIRLDFITIKSFLTAKNILIAAVASSVMMLTTGGSEAILSVIMMYAALHVSYPFAIGEKSDMDSLYCTLSITRKAVVLGRYLFALTFNLCAGVFANIIAFVLSLVMQKEINISNSLMITLGIFAVFSIIQAIQLPIYFKLGYVKAKFLAYLPLLGFPIAVFLLSRFAENPDFIESVTGFFGFFAENPVIAALFGVAVWLIIMLISYQVSKENYYKREF